ncbi:MAG TPA: c-type cytochrome domain-containing protein [Polyangia bacterium]|nr:c-type cytochrome domain-containing protein [Polyangia bacterium]
MQETRGAAPLLRRFSVALVAALVLGAPAAVSAPPPAPHPLTYAEDVAPLLDRWCVPCHSGPEADGGLWLDSLDGVLRGGDSGPVVVPSAPAASLLVAKIERRHRPSMPPRRRLPAAQIAILRGWIAAGAPR